MKSLLALLMVTGFLAAMPVRPVAADEAGQLERRVQTLLASFREKYQFPGATVAFVLPDGRMGSAATGLADIETATPMSPRSRMLAASIGKTWVGALVVALEIQGVLSRRDPVSTYLDQEPWFARLPNAAGITIGHLLTHTSGLGDHVHMEGAVRMLIERSNERAFEPAHAIDFVLDKPARFEPGHAWAYSDTGYLLLGLVIEAATGRDFYQLVAERFLEPLELNETSPSVSPHIEGLAVGYVGSDNQFGLPSRTMNRQGTLLWNPEIEWTGGGFVSTSSDLSKWGHLLFTGKALKQPYLDRLLDAVSVGGDAPGVQYASGVGVYAESEFGRVYGHGGWLPGYVSSLRHYADHGITIAFQINTDVGIVDNSTDLVPAMEAALARLIVQEAGKR